MTRFHQALVGYAECGLWSERCQGTADHDGCDGKGCDRSLSHDLNFDVSDIDSESANLMENDVISFIQACEAERPDVFDSLEWEQVGHDFWLTRNGHGAGFWDRGLGERGAWLTAMCRPFGEASLYVSDGKVHYQS